MTLKKKDDSAKVAHKLNVYLSESQLNKFKSWLVNSNCQSLSELARSILYREKIVWFHKDDSHETLMIELETIRKEISAVGKNINEVTRYFKSTDVPAQKIYEALRILEELKKISTSTDKLISLLNKHQNDSQDS